MANYQCEIFQIHTDLQFTWQSTVVLGMLVVTNFIALFTVASRLQKRYIRNTLWVDDIFAVATGCGLLFTLSNLFAMGSLTSSTSWTMPNIWSSRFTSAEAYGVPAGPRRFHVSSLVCSQFFDRIGTLSNTDSRASRACLVMSTGRLLYFTNRPQSLHFFWTISVLMFSCGIGYSVIASFFCINRTVCPDTGVCFCGLEPYLVFYTLLGEWCFTYSLFYRLTLVYT